MNTIALKGVQSKQSLSFLLLEKPLKHKWITGSPTVYPKSNLSNQLLFVGEPGSKCLILLQLHHRGN